MEFQRLNTYCFFQFTGFSFTGPLNSRFRRLSWIQFRAYVRWPFLQHHGNSFPQNATSARRGELSANRFLWSRQVHHFPWHHLWSQRWTWIHAWESHCGQNHPLRHGDWRKNFLQQHLNFRTSILTNFNFCRKKSIFW